MIKNGRHYSHFVDEVGVFFYTQDTPRDISPLYVDMSINEAWKRFIKE